MDVNTWIALVAIPAAALVGFGAAFISTYAINRNREAEQQFEMVRGLGRVEGAGDHRDEGPAAERFGYLRAEVAGIRDDLRDFREEARVNRGLIEQFGTTLGRNRQDAERAHVQLTEDQRENRRLIMVCTDDVAALRKELSRFIARGRQNPPKRRNDP